MIDRYRKWMGMTDMNDIGEAPATDAELLTAAEAEENAPAASERDTATFSQAEYERLKGERDQLLDRTARLQAEFENARKREAKERTEFREYAVGNAVEAFLPALDNFHLALKAQASPEQFRSGVELVAKQMEDAMRSLGVVPVETVGTPFNPHQHEALSRVDTAEHPDEQVLEEVRRGYRIKERLLRPALVTVAHNGTQHEA